MDITIEKDGKEPFDYKKALDGYPVVDGWHREVFILYKREEPSQFPLVGITKCSNHGEFICEFTLDGIIKRDNKWSQGPSIWMKTGDLKVTVRVRENGKIVKWEETEAYKKQINREELILKKMRGLRNGTDIMEKIIAEGYLEALEWILEDKHAES
jgi:hypothetical protein